MKKITAISFYNKIQQNIFIYLLAVYLLALLPFAVLVVSRGGLGHIGNLMLVCIWLPFVFTAAAFFKNRMVGLIVLSVFSVLQATILIEYPKDPMMELTRQLPTISFKKIFLGIFIASLIIFLESWFSKKEKTI